MTTCPQTVHGTTGLLRGRRSKSAGQADVGATVVELIDTIEGCGDAAFRRTRRDRQRSPSAVDLARVECKNVLIQPPAVDAHQRAAGLKLAERPFGGSACALKIIT